MLIEYPRKRPYKRRARGSNRKFYGDDFRSSIGGAAAIQSYYEGKPPSLKVDNAKNAQKAAEYLARKQARADQAAAAYAAKGALIAAQKQERQDTWAWEKGINKQIRDNIRADKAANRKAQAELSRAADDEAFKASQTSYSDLELYIPEWTDVIRIGADAPAGKAHWQEYYKARREGRPPNLPPDVIATLENKRRKMLAMKESQVPEAFQKLGQVLTTLDNINDAMVTAAYIAKVGALIAPPLAPFLAPLAAGLTLGAGVLNLAMWLSPLALPQQLAKRMLAKLGRQFGAKGLMKLLKIPPPLAKFLPSFSEFVQIAQTSADVVGYGLSLGPIYGAVQETFFRKVVNPIDNAVGNPLSGLSSWALKGVKAVGQMFSYGSLLDPMDHLADLVVLYICLSALCTPEVCAAFPYLIMENLESYDTTDYLTDDGNRELLVQEGVNPDQEWNHLLPYAPPILYLDDSITAFYPLISYNLTDWLDDLPDAFLTCFAGLLLAECADMFLQLLGGFNAPITTTVDPYADAIMQIVHNGLIPPQDADPREAQGYFESVARLRIVKGDLLTHYEILRIYLDYRFQYPPPHRF